MRRMVSAALLMAGSLLAQEAVLGGSVTTASDGALTATIMGPELPCPAVLDSAIHCSALNAAQILWVWASSTAPVTRFEVTVSFTSAGAAGAVKGTFAPADGGLILTLPIDAADVSVRVDSVTVRTGALVRLRAVGRR